MNTKPSLIKMLAFCLFGSALQIGALIVATAGQWPEVALTAAIVLYLMGSTLNVYGLESYVEERGRSFLWALFGLLGPLALITIRLSPKSIRYETVEAEPQTFVDKIIAWTLTVAISCGFAIGIAIWIDKSSGEARIDPIRCQSNERAAYQRLCRLIDAQNKYKQVDWDKDGTKRFAEFQIHLWRSVDAEGNPIPVNLISEDLGFSMVNAFALDGYTFKSLHIKGPEISRARKKRAAARKAQKPIDHQNEWAVAAVPIKYKEQGMLMMIADQTGHIWVREFKDTRRHIKPLDFSKEGWKKIDSISDLKSFQASLKYPELDH